MQYRNTRTGAVVEVQSEISGEWEPVKAPASDTEEPDPAQTEKKKTRTKKKAG